MDMKTQKLLYNRSLTGLLAGWTYVVKIRQFFCQIIRACHFVLDNVRLAGSFFYLRLFLWKLLMVRLSGRFNGVRSFYGRCPVVCSICSHEFYLYILLMMNDVSIPQVAWVSFNPLQIYGVRRYNLNRK